MTCVNTFEKHNGKIWSLDSREAEGDHPLQIISGGNDSLLCLWEDVTKQNELETKKTEGEKIQNQQKLRNLLREKNYLDAGKLSFDLNHSQSFTKVLENILMIIQQKTEMIFDESDQTLPQNETETEADKTLKDLVDYCIEKDLVRLLLLTRDLNSTSKHSAIAQMILKQIVSTVNLTDTDSFVEKLKNLKKDQKAEDIFGILLAYSERHHDRVRKYLKKSHYLDYVLKSCSALIPE